MKAFIIQVNNSSQLQEQLNAWLEMNPLMTITNIFLGHAANSLVVLYN